MQNKHPYELDFEQYIRNTEPAKKEKSYAWATAIGLQQVVCLTPSEYLCRENEFYRRQQFA